MNFHHSGEIIKKEEEDKISKTIGEICMHIKKEHRKGKIPLFIIGSGISSSLRYSGKPLDKGIPNIIGMIKKLKKLSQEKKIPSDLNNLFESWDSSKERKTDRSIVSRILMYFTETSDENIQKIWNTFIKWLLYTCVDETKKIGMLNAEPSKAHEKLAEMYKEADAICLTVNFDSLMYRALSKKFDENGQTVEKKVYTYSDPSECEDFFKRFENSDARAEIQARGDIFWAKCRKKEVCTLKGKIIPLLANEEYGLCIEEPTKCICGETRDILIAFPGTYKKDKIMQEIISKIWGYLAFKVSSVITLGFSGTWDPILIAFISDLLRERGIPFLDINSDSKPERLVLVKELIKTNNFNAVSINQPADDFMEELVKKYIKCNLNPLMYSFELSDDPSVGPDYFWDSIISELESDIFHNGTTEYEQSIHGNPSVKITHNFNQLGLKSKWLGINSTERDNHNRLNHSKAVMKIASYMYENACKNSNRKINNNELQFLRIAALLHDIGHLPFCHLIEEIFEELNWKTGGYYKSFSHGSYTDQKIDKIKIEKYLKHIGYEKKDLIQLINGEFGVGYLDAIINSPIDADKIEYVIRDSKSTGTSIRLDKTSYIERLVEEMSITPEGLLAFSGNSAKLAKELLDARVYLYNNLYLTPEIRFLESAVRFIITTYFVHKYNIIDWGEIEDEINYIRDKDTYSTHGISDLGPLRIQLAIEDLEKLVNKYKHNKDKDIELDILEHMKTYLSKHEIPIKEEIKGTIEKCYEWVSTIKTKKELVEKETDHFIHYEQLNWISGNSLERIQDIRKTVMLRFPGVVFIEIVPPPNVLSISDKRKARDRSDGTKEYSEYILFPSGEPDQWRKDKDHANIPITSSNLEREKPPLNVYIYKIDKEIDAAQAVDLFDRLIKKEELLGEV